MAFRLARLGHHVVLLGDGSPHHRRLPHSISPGIRPFLDLLDLQEPLDTFATECDPPDVRWDTAEPLERPASLVFGHLVDRSQMDVCLRDIARREGVQVITMRVSSIPVRRAEGGWRIPLVPHACGEVHAGFLVVATGRKPLVTQGRKRIMPPLLALHSRWKLPTRCGPGFLSRLCVTGGSGGQRLQTGAVTRSCLWTHCSEAAPNNQISKGGIWLSCPRQPYSVIS